MPSSSCRRPSILKKSHVGLTFIRDFNDQRISRSPNVRRSLAVLSSSTARPTAWRGRPTGINVPDYPKLAQLWWQQIGDVNSGAFTPQEAMDRLAGEMDDIMARMQAADEAEQDLWRLRPASQPGEGCRPSGSASRTDRRPSSKTRRSRARPSPMTSWSSAGPTSKRLSARLRRDAPLAHPGDHRRAYDQPD